MHLPATKLFKVIKGATFEYRFQLMRGTPTSSRNFDLIGYTGTWYIDPQGPEQFAYDSSAEAGDSGVFFGGDDTDPTNGIIDLTIAAHDTGTIDWRTASHLFVITSPDIPAIVIPLLTGGIGVIGSIPTI